MKKHPPPAIDQREDAPPGTIGWIFDRYRNSGKLPDNLIINSNNFKSSKNEREQSKHGRDLQK